MDEILDYDEGEGMNKFKASPWNTTIQQVEVERETEHCVWIRGRKNTKNSDFASYHDSWNEAKAFILAEAEDKAASLRRQLDIANSKIENIKGMKEPTSTP